MIRWINSFHATSLFRYPLKTSENQRFPDIFGGYQKRPVAWNVLTALSQSVKWVFDILMRKLNAVKMKGPQPLFVKYPHKRVAVGHEGDKWSSHSILPALYWRKSKSLTGPSKFSWGYPCLIFITSFIYWSVLLKIWILSQDCPEASVVHIH